MESVSVVTKPSIASITNSSFQFIIMEINTLNAHRIYIIEIYIEQGIWISKKNSRDCLDKKEEWTNMTWKLTNTR
jgi:hypothetical protein